MSKSLILTIVALASLTGASAHAQQSESIEERLRTQLRLTTSQLQAAQNELAALKAGQPESVAGPAAASGEVADLKKQLAQAKADLETERRARSRADAGTEQLQQQAQDLAERANAQIAQYRSSYDQLLGMARAAESERQRLAADATAQRTAIQQCEAKNQQLYAVGQEILRAYETVDFGDVLSSRQPFAAKARVKYEEIAQQYGDKLYEGRFDARDAASPVVATAETSK